MDRRDFVQRLGAFAALPVLGILGRDALTRRPSAPGPSSARPLETGGPIDPGDWEPLEKSEDEWRRILSEDEFEILREEGTERAGSSPLNEEHRAGTFICAGCFLPLFHSDDKFMSGTGWPSFTRHIQGHVDTKPDPGLFTVRTEYHCARCDGHQGHVFDDGPPPTGQRWCNNGIALDFVPDGENLPELRS